MTIITVTIMDDESEQTIEFKVNTLFYEIDSLIPILKAGYVIELCVEDDEE